MHGGRLELTVDVFYVDAVSVFYFENFQLYLFYSFKKKNQFHYFIYIFFLKRMKLSTSLFIRSLKDHNETW